MQHDELAYQAQGRPLEAGEQAFADALERIYKDGVHDFDVVAARLTEAGVKGPMTGETSWTVERLSAELEAINQSLDQAYAEHGFGS